ncbi:hypothetical protein RM704_10455 [Streptomyces sp. DSM 3412]|uniref:Uncharacterized protein n=1 Tax=Streptomyces gottesmaniae TaxID=3075518 RepID=A0ABU2YUX5_9ACTN|nr:hypothetical protein [Streptomyces sp. DSM 3412]MDT0567885.1 hypothetical protein [Streptomyces sp. DSM 3412]
MTHVVAVFVLVVTVAAIVCGHHNEGAPPFAARLLRSVRRRTNHPRSDT